MFLRSLAGQKWRFLRTPTKFGGVSPGNRRGIVLAPASGMDNRCVAVSSSTRPTKLLDQVRANSMGGWWTFQLAMQAPARVTRMVMIGCPAVMLNTTAPLPMRLISVPVLGRGLVKLMAPATAAKARDLPRFLGHPVEVGERWPETEAETAYRFGNLPNAPRSWLTLLRRFLRPWGPNRQMRISADELRGITQPTLFVWGKDDPFGSPGAGRAAVELMPQARLEVVGLGHLPWWDEPDACARLVREFVRPSEKP